mgnify:CR=1 FL=1
MYSFNKGLPEVQIDLPNGVYVFQRESGAGKSYLAERLHSLRSVGEPVDSFSFPDLKKFGSLEEALGGVDFTLCELKVILFDRYDQYAGKFTKSIQKLGDACIVLIDCKGLTQLSDVNMCDISFNKARIEVSAGAVHI